MLEVVEAYDGNAFRAVYTVKLEGVVYALHAFQKKSTKGRKTAVGDIAKIEARLKLAIEIHAHWRADEAEKEKDDETS